jgi:sec-independent protein translocase protein TatC
LTELRRELPSDGNPPGDVERPIWDHIVELSIRLRRIFLAILIAGGVLSFIPIDFKYYIPLVSYFPNYIINYVLPQEVTWRGHVYHVQIAQYNPFAGFSLLLKSALLLGLLGASPVIAHEVYAYIEPALFPHEKRWFKRLSSVAIGLFMVGLILAFKFVLPFAFKIMIITSVAVVGNKLIAIADVQQLFTTIILIAIATGLAFEAPLIVYLLVALGIVDEKWFHGENLKYLFLASMFLGAVISPDPSGIGMVVIGTAMFLAIVVAARLGARHKRPEAEVRLRSRRRRELRPLEQPPSPAVN